MLCCEEPTHSQHSLSLCDSGNAGNNDVTLILKPQCGSRRWQHQLRKTGSNEANDGSVEHNYTIILGSHRNSCLKIEKDGELCYLAHSLPSLRLSPTAFRKFWLSCDGQSLSIGTGDPSPETAHCRWIDDQFSRDVNFVGLSAWDSHVGYRNIRAHPAVDFSGQGCCLMDSLPPMQSDDRKSSTDCHCRTTTEPILKLVDISARAVLSSMTLETVCTVLMVTEMLLFSEMTIELRQQALQLLVRNFSSLISLKYFREGFSILSTTTLCEILQHQDLVCNEKRLLDTIVEWATRRALALYHGCEDKVFSVFSVTTENGVEIHEEKTRIIQSEIEALLPFIRFPLMTEGELRAVEADPFLQSLQSSLLHELILEARLHSGDVCHVPAIVKGDRLVADISPLDDVAALRHQPRTPPGCVRLLYMYDGDCNGVCYYIGTRYGAQTWVNPVLAGLMTVKASSPTIRGTDPRALCGRSFQRHNFAGPRRQRCDDGTERLTSWWSLDLGNKRALDCSYYSIRADGSQNFLRNWALQGSNDEQVWDDLRVHESDTTLTMPGQYASWPVKTAGGGAGVTRKPPYRYFRIVLLRPNEDATNPHHLCLSCLELYGLFYNEDVNTG